MAITGSRYAFQAGTRDSMSRALLVVLCAVFMMSCDDTASGDDRCRVRLDVDWSGYGKSEPTGMTVVCHNDVTGEKTQVSDNNLSYVTPSLSPGRHWATVFNLTEEEFDNIRFRGLEAVETAEAYVRKHDGSGWYTAPPLAGDSYIAGQPEWLAADTVMTAAVATLPAGAQPEVKVIGRLRPQNIIHTLHVTVHVVNIGSLRAVRGAIGGLAAGRRLAGDSSADNAVTVTHLIESGSWTCRPSYSTPGEGIVKADVRCFGLPALHKGTSDENRLELQLLLADGKTVVRHDIAVGHLIEAPAAGTALKGDNLDLYLDLRLDEPLPPSSGDGGIDVWFDDWDDYVDFNMPI